MWSQCDAHTKDKWSRDQEELKRKLVEADEIDFKWADEASEKPPLNYIAGLDLRYIGNTNEAMVSLVIVDWPGMQVAYESFLPVTLTTPAMPGFLGFREAGPMLELIKKVIAKHPDIVPQALIIHGAGKYDVEGFGVACHVGVISGIPTVGITTEWLEIDGLQYNQIREHIVNGSEAVALLGLSNTLWGMAFVPPCEMNGSKRMIYTSIGNKLGLQTAIELVKATCISHLPEPVVQAIRCNEVAISKRLSASPAADAADSNGISEITAYPRPTPSKSAAAARQRAAAAYQAAQKGANPSTPSKPDGDQRVVALHPRPVESPFKTPPAEAPVLAAIGDGEAEFIPVPEFSGTRPGYVFQLGPKGLGYYRDPSQPLYSSKYSASPHRGKAPSVPVSPSTASSSIAPIPRASDVGVPHRSLSSNGPQNAISPAVTTAQYVPPVPPPFPSTNALTQHSQQQQQVTLQHHPQQQLQQQQLQQQQLQQQQLQQQQLQQQQLQQQQLQQQQMQQQQLQQQQQQLQMQAAEAHARAQAQAQAQYQAQVQAQQQQQQQRAQQQHPQPQPPASVMPQYHLSHQGHPLPYATPMPASPPPTPPSVMRADYDYAYAHSPPSPVPVTALVPVPVAEPVMMVASPQYPTAMEVMAPGMVYPGYAPIDYGYPPNYPSSQGFLRGRNPRDCVVM